jgi:hypothetical protein
LQEQDERDYPSVVMRRDDYGRSEGAGGYEEFRQGYVKGQMEVTSHERSGSAGSAGSDLSGKGNMYGGGAMPGPKYMLNMHPGVPVYKN